MKYEYLGYSLCGTDSIVQALKDDPETKLLTILTKPYKLIKKSELKAKTIDLSTNHLITYAHWLLRRRQTYWQTWGRTLYADCPREDRFYLPDLRRDWYQELNLELHTLRVLGLEGLTYYVAKGVIMDLWTEFRLKTGLIQRKDDKDYVSTEVNETYYDDRSYLRSPFMRPDHNLLKQSRLIDAGSWDLDEAVYRTDGWVDIVKI